VTAPRVPPGRLAGVTYRHRDGWRLHVPYSLMRHDDRARQTLQLGGVVLTLHHPRRTVEGDVPASWRVDLNA
jgi:hypothetical protein